MRKFLTLLILLVFAMPAYGATIYKWVDEKGVIFRIRIPCEI